MKRYGRKRKMVNRTPSGQPSRAGQSAINPQMLAQRAGLVGNENAKDPKAGSALGILALRGVIATAQCDAGLAFEKFYRAWRRMAGSRSPWEQSQGGPAPHVSPDDWQKACDTLAAINAKIDQSTARALIRGAIDCIVIDNILPPIIEAELRHTSATGGQTKMMYAKAIQALIAGLDILAPFFIGGRAK